MRATGSTDSIRSIRSVITGPFDQAQFARRQNRAQKAAAFPHGQRPIGRGAVRRRVQRGWAETRFAMVVELIASHA
jgi:hypothetical protein